MKLLFTSLLAALPFSISSAAVLGKTGTGLFLLTTDNALVTLSDSAPASASPPVPIINVAAGDTLVAIDVRPINQQLYALGINSSLNTFRLYHLSPETGMATPLSVPQSINDAIGNPLPAAAVRYDIDFNPTADRLRVVNANGANFRMNPNTGDCVDSNGNSGVNADSAINGATTTVEGAAYTNNDPFSTIATLYTLDPTTDGLYVSSSPNNGIQGLGLTVTLNGNLLNFTATRGFDIAPGAADADISGGPVSSGYGYAALTAGITSLYQINLSTGVATSLGTPAGFSIASLAVRTQTPVAIGLDAAGPNLVNFRPETPGTTITQPITGIGSGEVLVGIDFRPATGQLMGLGVNSTTEKATLYNIDPRGGGASPVGAASQIEFTTDGVNLVDLPGAATGYGFDFNPSVDRIRVVTGSGLNFRVNPVNGAPVDGNNMTAGINPDGDINGGSTVVTAAAYTNSYSMNLTGGTTTLYTLDHSSNSLFIQNPPNNGTQAQQKFITVNGSTLDFTAANGFDITAEGGTNVVSNTASPGYGWAALSVGGTTSLYRINLLTGVATPKGQIGSGGALSGFTLSSEAGAGFAPLSWASVIGTSYRIETSEDLANWQPYPVPVQAVQATTTVPVPLYQGEARRFWRAVTTP